MGNPGERGTPGEKGKLVSIPVDTKSCCFKQSVGRWKNIDDTYNTYLFYSSQGIQGPKGNVGGIGEKVGYLSTSQSDKYFVDQ